MNAASGRRRFLIGAACAGVAAAAAVPFFSRPGLARLATAGRRADGPRIKVVFFVIPDGLGINGFASAGAEWNPQGAIWHPAVPDGVTDTDQFTLNVASQALEKHRDKALFLRYLENSSAFGGHNAWTSILRATGGGTGSSIDVLLARALPGNNPVVGAAFAGPMSKVGVGGNAWYVSYDNGVMRTPQKDPRVLFENLVGTPGILRRTRSASAILDPAMADLEDIRGKVHGSERAKLDTHMDSMEQLIEDIGGTLPPSCDDAAPPEAHPVDDPNFRNEVQAAHHQVIATALSCGIMRVATIQVAYSSEQSPIPGIDPRSAHDIAHWGQMGSEESAVEADRRRWQDRATWYTAKVSDFLDTLSRYADPDVPGDSLLDHTLVVYTSEMACGAREHMMDMPLVFLGGASGRLINGTGNGRYYDVMALGDVDNQWQTGRPRRLVRMQRVWGELGRALGVEVPYAGNMDPIPDLFRPA
ncbi:DUF1552 domain-containing protein [Stenotrophomonas sp. AB1(2024)]|uniref:DUF1552 domain-containing protein n=1 Tax=Stenotrophomonas sp. AB1(2024) TaxID=3132215 RepID=UPI003096254A